MDIMNQLTVMFLSAALFFIEGFSLPSAESEYCMYSAFNLTCPRNHVILMEQASFGRMRTGGCIKKDENIGCKMDVLPQMHKLCSGRTSCTERVPYTTFQDQLQCLDELVAYTAVVYKCVGVVSTRGRQCQQHKPITIQDAEGYISSSTFQGRSCVFEIVIPKGQTVLLTFLNFKVNKTHQGWQSHCFVYTKEHTRKTALCEQHYTKNIFASKSNQVFIELRQPHPGDANHFLIKYEAVGCKDPEIPADTWFKREENGVMVQCNHTNQRWHLVCRDNSWVGTMDNCTSEASGNNGRQQKQDIFPFSLIIAVLVGIFIGILLGVALLCTASCVLKHRRSSKNCYGTSNISQGPDHSFMLQSKAYPFDHSYECTTTRQSSIPPPPQGIVGLTTNTEDCNPNCPYNTLARSDEQRGKCSSRQQTGLRLWQDTPSIIRDSEGELLQSHYWDNSNTTCVCPVVEECSTRMQGQRSTHENSLDKSEDTLNQMPSHNQQISALR